MHFKHVFTSKSDPDALAKEFNRHFATDEFWADGRTLYRGLNRTKRHHIFTLPVGVPERIVVCMVKKDFEWWSFTDFAANYLV